MPTSKDLKRLVRARMQKTGESYTAARARLLEKRPARTTRRAVASAAPPVDIGDLAELAGTRDAAVKEKTGRTWKEWVRVLDGAGAAELGHTAIARLLRAEHGVPSWWSQTVAIGYERIRGLRAPGQRSDGSFAASKSKVYPVPLADLWTAFVRCERWLDGAKLRMSTARKPKSMRMRWSDDTPVDAYFVAKGPAKSQVAIEHRKLRSRAEVERMRAFWGACLARLAVVIAEKD
jgi:hypothetical protein